MLTTESPKSKQVRRTRKSIAHMPSPELGLDKENTKHGKASMGSFGKMGSRKPRSKSIGPGGLDALKEDAGNKQKTAPIVRSILKPSIYLSPPKPIPPYPSSRKTSPRKSPVRNSPQKRLGNETSETAVGSRQSGVETLPNPFNIEMVERSEDKGRQEETRISVRTEEEQQEAARKRERQEAVDRRDARRKSLANRRVSFAPEATLHTWDVVELAEDATTSSEATNSTRRASSGSTLTASPTLPKLQNDAPSLDLIDPPSTPPGHGEIQITASPADQRAAHQRKRRRSSGIPPMNFNNPDEFSSSPTSSLVSDETDSQAFVTADGDIDSSEEDKDLVEAEATVTGVDEDDSTSQSVPSFKSAGSTSSSGRLEASLRQAASHAGTQGIGFDEHGDITMEMADDEVTAAFKPWVKQDDNTSSAARQLSSMEDQENLNPFSPAFKAILEKPILQEENLEQTMDITQAAGSILTHQESPNRSRRKSVVGGKRKSIGKRRQSSGEASEIADDTMDLTVAIGGIQQSQPMQKGEESDSLDDNEDLTMEFTSVIGGVVNHNNEIQLQRSNSVDDDRMASQQLLFEENRRASIASTADEEDMDMTMAMGGILSSITERTEPSEDGTVTMDITTAIGAILPSDLRTEDKSVAKMLMEQETDHGQLSRAQFEGTPQGHREASRMATLGMASHLTTTRTDAESPSFISAQSRNARRSGNRPSITPKAGLRQMTPLKTKPPSTPSKQFTPQSMRPVTPGKTPPSKNVAMRTASPKKLFKADIKKAAASPIPANPALKFNEDAITGITTPSIVLIPRGRRSSGLGVDKEGLGSPRVAAILDQRRSIGDNAESFTPQGNFPSKVRFEDPRALEEELEHERREDERRESGRGILQLEADVEGVQEEKDATTNLRDMIESLTPKKNKLKGRKSLHVGAAKGLLGKRPVELDDEEEDPSPKRLKGRERSPVKNIRLPGPPSKSDTIGRLTNPPRFSLGGMNGNKQVGTPTTEGFPQRKGNTTPKNHSRFKDTELILSAAKPPVPFSERLTANPAPVVESTDDEERIHLQDFLNMTSIRFMELTTTKRRHTVAPNSNQDDTLRIGFARTESKVDYSNQLEACVVAGACTVPMLELYQHSCRELKKYISEGRSIVQEIEADTFEENPPLFCEYLTAPPDVRSIMDNQFKNVKTHARLLSKATWYEWRMKLLDGLKQGLMGIGEGLGEDANHIAQQESLLHSVVPELVSKHEQLEAQASTLQSQADELASCDQEELQDARERLVSIKDDLEAKQQMLAGLQEQLNEKEQAIEDMAERKQECLGEMKEAEKVREECRGWSGSEVAALKANVDALEKSHGWSITSASGSSIALTYRHTLRLFLTPSAFLATTTASSTPSPAENAPISLIYIADTDEHHPRPLSTEKRFFLQILRARLQCLPQSATRLAHVLAFVAAGWEQACAVADETRALDLGYMTEAEIRADELLSVSSVVLLRQMATKVLVAFEVSVGEGPAMELQVDVRMTARVAYGERLNEEKMDDFLRLKLVGGMGWAAAVGELEERLVKRGRKPVAA